MRFLNISILLLLASCASVQPQAFKGPNGKTAYSMQCSGGGRTLHDCFIKAGEICPGGYNIVSQATGSRPAYINGQWFQVPKQELAIECK